MKAFLATVLSVIAVGVLLIAYGLLAPRAMASDVPSAARPMFASERIGYVDDGYGDPGSFANAYAGSVRRPTPYSPSDFRAVPVSETYLPRAPQRVVSVSRARAMAVNRVERGRDWKKTAMVIGGSTAAGAGLGAIFGGKKGALIGAALGGGAGTLFEVKKR
jgi:hypothetical protein